MLGMRGSGKFCYDSYVASAFCKASLWHSRVCVIGGMWFTVCGGGGKLGVLRGHFRNLRDPLLAAIGVLGVAALGALVRCVRCWQLAVTARARQMLILKGKTRDTTVTPFGKLPHKKRKV